MKFRDVFERTFLEQDILGMVFQWRVVARVGANYVGIQIFCILLRLLYPIPI